MAVKKFLKKMKTKEILSALNEAYSEPASPEEIALSEAPRLQGGASRIAETFQSRRKCGAGQECPAYRLFKSLHSSPSTGRGILQHFRKRYYAKKILKGEFPVFDRHIKNKNKKRTNRQGNYESIKEA